jgi:transcription-repair coupling factor (superfamily II helicase)
MQGELIDRFGLLPDAARSLLECHRLRLAAKPLGIMRIEASADYIQVHFVRDPPVDPARIVALIQRHREYELSGPDRLKVRARMPNVTERVKRIKNLIAELSNKTA